MQINTLELEIIAALEEAMILEEAREAYDTDHILEVAQRLAHAPFSFVQEVAHEKFFW